MCNPTFTVPVLQLLYHTNTAVYVVQNSSTFTSLINTNGPCLTQSGACFYPMWFSNYMLYCYIYKNSVFCLFSLHDKEIFLDFTGVSKVWYPPSVLVYIL